MSKEYQAKQAELVASHIAKQDIVITTALIPGRPAPRLVTAEMLKSMAPGSVVVDLAVERGGNVEGAKPGSVAKVGNVSIVGYLNMAGRIAATASLLYAKNLLAFLETMVDKENKKLAVNMEDELVKATLLTHDGKVVHPAFVGKVDAEAPAKSAAKPATKAKTASGTSAKAGAGKKPAAKKTSKADKPADEKGDAK